MGAKMGTSWQAGMMKRKRVWLPLAGPGVQAKQPILALVTSASLRRSSGLREGEGGRLRGVTSRACPLD